MSKHAPAFQMYANDFMDGTRFWDANAVGLYIRCMCIQWTQGGLPKDVRTLSRGVGMDFEEVRTLWEVVGSKFEEGEDGLLRNARMEAVRLRQQDVSSKRSNAASKRWDEHANASANDNAKTKQRKVKVKEKVKEKKEGEVENAEMMPWPSFEDFWEAYERKGSKTNAEKEWAKIGQSDREAIMTNVPNYNYSKPDKQFRKDGERFLKLRTWEDEIVIPTNIASKSQTKNQTNAEYANAVGAAFAKAYGEDRTP